MAVMHFLVAPAGVTPLATDKHCFFGRAEGNSIVVDDLRASRRHAELYYDGSDFVLIDLDSSNGTFVNGKTISSVVLNDGDRIEIGSQSYIFRRVADPSELQATIQSLSRDARLMETSTMPAMGAQSIPDTDFNGTLATMGVMEICQMLQLGRRTGMLVVRNAKGEKGFLYFDNGKLIGAEAGLVSGDDAVYQILRFQEGTFSFRARHAPLKPNVRSDTTHLLLEAARKRDEEPPPGS